MADILDKLAKEVDKISKEDADNSKKEEALQGEEVESSDSKDSGSAMGKLISRANLNFPKVGDSVTGAVIEVSSNELYLDLAPFGTGIVLGREIKDGMGSGKVKLGDKVSAIVTDTENEDGYIELSIREASYEKAWEDIESKRDIQEKMTVKIINANKGGLLVEINGISGFLPVSQLSSKNYPRVEDGDKNKILTLLKKLIGQELEVRILDADKESEKLIVSEKAAQSEKEKEVISNLSVGDVVEGEVSGVVDFGAFIKFSLAGNESKRVNDENKLEGLVHISELAWQLIEDPRSIIKVGDKVKAQIIGIDADKISLSIRALQRDPWSEISKKYKVNDIVLGTIHKINHFGAFVYLDKDIHGLAHISEMSETYPGKSINELIETGKDYNWKILSIEPKEHRMGLVLVLPSKKSSSKETEKLDKKIEEKKEKKNTEEKIEKKEPKKTSKK